MIRKKGNERGVLFSVGDVVVSLLRVLLRLSLVCLLVGDFTHRARLEALSLRVHGRARRELQQLGAPRTDMACVGLPQVDTGSALQTGFFLFGVDADGARGTGGALDLSYLASVVAHVRQALAALDPADRVLVDHHGHAGADRT